MKAISYAGVDFAANNVTARIVRGLPGPEANPLTLPRPGTHPIPLGMTVGTRPIAIRFDPINVSGEAAMEATLLTLLGLLDLTDQDERSLVVELDVDGNGTAETTAEVFAAIGQWTWMPDLKALTVTFHATDATLRATGFPTTHGASISSSGDSFVVTNDGHARAYPIYKVGWTVQRATESPDVGWKYRRTVTLTNNETRSEKRETKCIDLGDTAAWVTAGKALASGNDVRVFQRGKGELPRTLANFNTLRTLMYVAVDVPRQKSLTLDIAYGNPDAGVPFTLAELGHAENDPGRFSAIDQFHTNGQATSGGALQLNDTGQAWAANRLRDGHVQIVNGAGAPQRRRIDSNGPTQIVPTRAFSPAPNNTSEYVVWMSGIYADGGLATSFGSGTNLTDSAQSFIPGSLVGGALTNVTQGYTRTIIGNTATTITYSPSSPTADPNDVYYVERQGCHLYSVEQETKRSSVATDTLPRGDVWSGGWFQRSRFTPGPATLKASDGIPNAWDLYLLLRNNDDFAQSSVFSADVDPGGGVDLDPFNGLDADRRVGSDRLLSEEGVADGVTITNPHGYDVIFFDAQLKNPNSVATFTVRARTPGGSEWLPLFDTSAASASLTPIAAQDIDLFSEFGEAPLHLYMGLVPTDETEEGVQQIPSTFSANDVATVRWYRRLELFLNLANWSVGVVSAEEDIYDLNAKIKLGALAQAPPYDQIEFGGPGHFCPVPSGQAIWVRTDPDTTEPLIAFYNGSTLVAPAPWAGVVYRYISDQSGNAVATIADESAPLATGNNTLTVFEDEIGTITVTLDYVKGWHG